LKPYAVDADWEILSRELIARCHALGLQVFSDALAGTSGSKITSRQ